ncbi:MAG: MFS transporter [Candidatus Yanofskybacteria bacterium]|nr:MFS transporter [Candidatus Yanofskybacteria bacterium]
MNNKNIFLWALYDFANSIVSIVFFLYFSQWLVIDRGVSDLWFNLIFAGSSALLLMTAPVLGSIADKLGNNMKLLRIATLAFFGLDLIIGLITMLLPQMVMAAAIFFLLANYAYQLSFSFYNPLLEQIAPPSKRGWISGIGQSASWFGQIVGLLITLPFVSGGFTLFGEPGRAQVFLPATLIFLVLALPTLLGFREKPSTTGITRVSIKGEYGNYKKSFLSLMTVPGIGIFLLGYFFFNDAVLTVSNNFPIYLQKVFQISDKTKSFLLIGILITSALGALIGGKIGDRIGLKKTMMYILGIWLITMPLLASLSNFTYFILVTTIFGFLYGATWTVTRAVMTYLVPKNKLTYAFSFYTLAERFSTFVGPISWGLIVYSLPHLGVLRYRLAMLTMALFILIGFLISRKVPDESKIAAIHNSVKQS